MTEDTTHKPFVLLLYLGVRAGQDMPKVHEWAEIDDVLNDGSPLPEDVKTRIYGAKKKRHNNVAVGASPGAIYRFEQDETSTGIFPHSANYQGEWKNKDDVARWLAESHED